MQENKVTISDLFNSRLDPHFYRKEFINLINSLDNSIAYKLGDIVEFSNETWDQNSSYIDDFPYIEISEIDIKTGKIQKINWCRVKEAPSRAKMILDSGDIIISTTRPQRGAISIIPSKYKGYIASTGFSIIRKIKKNDLLKEYLYTFLRTNLSLQQMLQRSSGGNYPAINQEELKKILVPVPSVGMQEQIVKIMSDANIKRQEKYDKAKDLLESINDILFKELNIVIPKIDNKKEFKTTISNILGSRLDPKYHQPKYETLAKYIKTNIKDLYSLEDICDEIISGQRPKGGVSQVKEGIPSLGGEHVLRDGTIETKNLKFIPEDFHKKQIKSKIKPLDIILVKDGATTGKVGIIPEEYPFKEANINEHVFILRCKKHINPYYILAFLLSEIGQTQIEREISGATIMGITKDSLKNILIPLPSYNTQILIANEYNMRLEQAQNLKKEADKEFEKSKARVERIILGEENL